jgi:general secretion pathway protein J
MRSMFLEALTGQKRHLQYSKGYTFIEVLIATAIFSSMVVLATMALNQGLRQYQGLMEKRINFWDKAKYLWADNSFSGITDYYVKSGENTWFPYFYGDQTHISYVSLSPVAGNLPVAVWIIKEQRDNGRYAVVYYELPVYTKTLKDLEMDYVSGNYKNGYTFVLLDDVENLSMDFYGYDSRMKNFDWYQDFDGAKNFSLPSMVRLMYDHEDKKQMMVYAINVNSRRKAAYNE